MKMITNYQLLSTSIYVNYFVMIRIYILTS